MDCFLANNTTSSECSSGCESGWTLYLDNSSSISQYDNKEKGNFVGGKCGFREERRSHEEEEEEDLSMVSDASSGPPHFPEEVEDYMINDDPGRCFYHAHAPQFDATLCKNSCSKKQKINENHSRKIKKAVHHEKPSLLDDTASSPLFNLDLPSKNINLPNNHGSAETLLDFSSQGYSTNHFEEESSPCHRDQYEHFFHSSLSGNHLHQNQWFGSSRWQP